MSYPKELCQLIVENMEIIEKAPNVIDEIEKNLFGAINQKVEERVNHVKGEWEGVYDLVTNIKYKETSFKPKSWTKDDNDWYQSFYTIIPLNLISHWLSRATGVDNNYLSLSFNVNHDWYNLKNNAYQRKLEEFYNNNKAIKDKKFEISPNKKYISRPFIFESKNLCNIYPNFDLTPLDEALNDLFSVHEEFDKFVQELIKLKEK